MNNRMWKSWSKTTIDDRGWLIREDKKVLVCVEPGHLMKAFGIGNMSQKVRFDDLYVLRNIYVLPEYRREGIFTQVMEDIYDWMAMNDLAIILFPSSFELVGDVINSPSKVKVEYGDEEESKRLEEWYKEFGFSPVKTGLYSNRCSYKNGVYNSMIFEQDGSHRRAVKDEYYANVGIEKNIGKSILGSSFSLYIPKSPFYQPEIHPNFI